MKIEAKSILSSKDSRGNRIDTILVTFPRFILAELNTHRLFSRNSASSRAIPFKAMVKSVEENPFVPIAYQSEHTGMQGTEYITDEDKIRDLNFSWERAKRSAIIQAKELNQLGVTKQLCNRLLEPFMYHTVLITATEFSNFFELRCPRYSFGTNTNNPKVWKSRKEALIDFPEWKERNELFWLSINKGQAEIHMMALAESMYDCINEAEVQKLKDGEWHIPFITVVDEANIADKIGYDLDGSDCSEEDFNSKLLEYKIKISTARCARTSYTTVENKKEFSFDKDIQLHDILLTNGHASPMEHIARCMTEEEYESFIKGKAQVVDITQVTPNEEDNLEPYVIFDGNFKFSDFDWCNNFKGFLQYRYLVENNKQL